MQSNVAEVHCGRMSLRLHQRPHPSILGGWNTSARLWTCWTWLVCLPGDLRDSADICVDPEVSTLNSLTNVQNSLFVPNLGRLLNRHPTYTLSRRPPNITEEPTDESELKTLSLISTRAKTRQEQEQIQTDQGGDLKVPSRTQRRASISSHLSDADDQEQFAVLPHGISLAGWSKEDKAELNDHVRHMLHSKRSKFTRSVRAFGKYVRKRKANFFRVPAIY